MKTSWFYYAGRWIAWAAFRLLTSVEYRGKENIPEKGAIVIASNHMNLSDPPLVALTVPRKLAFLAKEELFQQQFFRYFVIRFGAIRLSRNRFNVSALKEANAVLDAGCCLVVFPEGMRSRKGGLLEAFPGAAMIAYHNNVPILPIGISGTEKMVGKNWVFKRPKIIVNIGPPFTLERDGRVTREQLIEMTDTIMCRIAELLPPEYHGHYAKKVLENANRKIR